jgi:hypothetical protein
MAKRKKQKSDLKKGNLCRHHSSHVTNIIESIDLFDIVTLHHSLIPFLRMRVKKLLLLG